jgi:glutamine amidotransferase-like uncharacterized protein
MKSNLTLFIVILLSTVGYSQTRNEGFYKDIFMDGGVGVYNRTSIPAADSLGLSVELIAIDASGDIDSTEIQNDRMAGNTDDINGILLYPDGSPRFRLLHTNGGSATTHGNSLGEVGRENVRTFFKNGGCYTGVCAGAFITSINYQTTGTSSAYYHIFPGRTVLTNVLNTYTGHFIEPNSPLLQYSNFGGNGIIANIYHDGGCYANEVTDFPENAEILLRFQIRGKLMDKKVSCWAYKDDLNSGRLVVIGSHPEIVLNGEGLDLMKAILQYALKGQGTVNIKGSLENGIPRLMNKLTEDNDPNFCKIGDKQYHHFSLDIPTDIPQLSLKVTAPTGYHFNIYLNKDTVAFRSNALYSDITNASEKTLIINQLSAGHYYVSVECETTVDATKEIWGYAYNNNLEVLNGIAYTIEADYELTSLNKISDGNEYSIYPNPATTFINIKSKKEIRRILITDVFGKTIQDMSANSFQNDYKIDLSGISKGVYFISIDDGFNNYVKKIIKQ